jgi:CheY-like chemotaxis protein
MTAPQAPTKPRIAIVEDNEDSALLAKASLEQYFEIDVYTNGEAALAAFGDAPPIAIVLDIGLRGMDGVQVLRGIRENPALARVPVVAMTGYTTEGIKERFIELGFDRYVAKPLQSPDQLLKAVTSAIKQRLTSPI